MQTLVDLVKDAAERYGDSTALTITPGFREQRWSYRRLWDSSGRVANFLRQRGLEKGDRVVIWAPNRPEWVVAFFGCMRAGIIAVPLDARSAPDFAARVFERTEPKLVFLSRHTPGDHGEVGVPVVLLEELEESLEGVAADGDGSAPTPEDIVEVMFTSGTTGDPKGVILTHANILSNVLAATEVVPLTTSHRMLSLMPLSHMMEQTAGLLAPIHGGARIVYPVSRQPKVIFKTLQSNRITNMVLVPQVLQLFMGSIERQVAAKGKERQWELLQRVAARLPVAARRLLFRPVIRQLGGKVSFFISGGAYLDPALAQKWANLGIFVLQGYGATEASPIITTNTFRKTELTSVGRVVPGQELRIADDGEVLTRGPNVTQGYWRNPEATAAAFEDGWYKTGDLGSIDDQGFLYLKGRKKDLIVLANGQNVYPEDVEAPLAKESGIRDRVVVGLPKDGGSVEVHAVLLMDDASQAAEMVRRANTQLAAHQQIQGFTVWPEEDFPRTHTLKIKTPLVLEYLLRQAGQDGQEPAQAPPEKETAAVSDLQRVIALACALPVAELTPEKTLGMDLNLDSLNRVELLSAIEHELGAFLDDEQVGPETTLGELEALIQEGAHGQSVAFPGWGRRVWCRVLRAFLQYALIFPFLRLLYTVKVHGKEHFRELAGPVLFVSNHNLMMDSPTTLMAFPFKWKWRLSPAAAADAIFGHRLKGIANILLGNAFPFAREGAVRSSLAHLGQLLDMGWSVLIYPEGDRYLGEMEPFKAGAGLIAVESQTPVVPIRVKLHKRGLFDHASLLSRGEIEITFGRPLIFKPGTDYLDATARLEQAVRAL